MDVPWHDVLYKGISFENPKASTMIVPGNHCAKPLFRRRGEHLAQLDRKRIRYSTPWTFSLLDGSGGVVSYSFFRFREKVNVQTFASFDLIEGAKTTAG